MMKCLARHYRWPLAAVGLLLLLAGCSLGRFGAPTPHPPQVLHLAAIFPARGVDGPLGWDMRRGVELAVRQHIRLAKGYRLALTTVNEVALSRHRLNAVLRKRKVLAIVGLAESTRTLSLLPVIERQMVPTISPTALLPSLPAAPSPVLFRLAGTNGVAGRAAADLAVTPVLAAHTVFLADDGSRSGRALATAFAAELSRRGGLIAGQRTITPRDPNEVQGVVSAIIEADPPLVFYAGDTAAGAALRRTLSLTGAPQVPLLTAGPIADHPGWVAAVGMPATSASTLGLLPAPDLSTLSHLHHFLAGYRRAFPGHLPSPQSALAYDAAMDEITAMRALIHRGKPVTRRSIRALIAGRRYRGVTGSLAFNPEGVAASPRFSLYRCDLTGRWRYRGVTQ